MTKNYIIATIMSFVVFSCTTQKTLMTATKNLHIAGAKSGKNYVDYNVELTETRDFEIIDVQLVDYPNPLQCYYYDTATRLSSSKKKTPFLKGTYVISFQIEDKSMFEKVDKVKVKIKIDNIVKEQILEVRKGETVVGK